MSAAARLASRGRPLSRPNPAVGCIIVKDGVAHCQAGAGIVYDSDPDREYEETVNKAMAMDRALKMLRPLTAKGA